jgi:UPF0271 protein
MARRVDLNADLGEGVAVGASDVAIMRAITSTSVACGVHAGSREVMSATVELARAFGVVVGAHPGVADRLGAGRRETSIAAEEAEHLVLSQIEALGAVAALSGIRLHHVKPHGALYNMAARDLALAQAIARAVHRFDPSLVLFGLSGSRLLEAGAAAGLRTASEVFADRAYRPDGALVPRSEAGALIVDPDVVVGRVVEMVCDDRVSAIDGSVVPVTAETICVHGDTPQAAVLAARIRQALTAAGVSVRALTSP